MSIIPDKLVNKSEDRRSLMSGDINEDDEDVEEDVEFPESGEWLGKVTDDKFGMLLHDNPFPRMELPPFWWLFCDEPLNKALTKEGGEGLGGFTTFVQLTKSANSWPTISLKSSNESSVNGKLEGYKKKNIYLRSI